MVNSRLTCQQRKHKLENRENFIVIYYLDYLPEKVLKSSLLEVNKYTNKDLLGIKYNLPALAVMEMNLTSFEETCNTDAWISLCICLFALILMGN